MKILSLETSTERASIALWLNGQITERMLAGSAAASATILPDIQRLLAEAQLRVADLDVIAFGAGPGAFTGVRLACGVAQGLALGADKPVAPIDSLMALAEPVESQRIYCAMDARMNEAYVARFERLEGALKGVGSAECLKPDQIPVPEGEGWTGVGTAFGAYRDAMGAALGARVSVLADDAVPLASSVARLAAKLPQHWIDPALAAPNYVRNRVAYTVAERLAMGGKA